MTPTPHWTEVLDIEIEHLPPWCLEYADDWAQRPKGGGGTPPLTARGFPCSTDREPGGHLGVDLRGTVLAASTEEDLAEGAPPLLLTIQQAADRLTVGRCTMQQLVLAEEVRSFKIGKLRRIPPEALDEYIARKMQP